MDPELMVGKNLLHQFLDMYTVNAALEHDNELSNLQYFLLKTLHFLSELYINFFGFFKATLLLALLDILKIIHI